MIYGYARISTADQTLDPQRQALEAAGVPPGNITGEIVSGGMPATRRPGLGELMAKLQPGDSLIAVKLDRLGRDAADVLALARDLEARDVGLRLLDIGLDTSTAAGRLLVGLLASVASWERDIIRERTKAGLASARRAGRIGGRRPALSAPQIELARRLAGEGQSLREIARQLRGRYGTPSAETIRRALIGAMADGG